MAAISDEHRFINVLRTMPFQRGKVEVLAVELRSRYGDKWTDERVRQKAGELDANSNSSDFLGRHGGHYFGAENLATSGPYKAVKLGARRWGRDSRYGAIDAEIVGKPGKDWSHGDWSCPDMVFVATRRVTARKPQQIHVVEIEQADGLGIQSVYQAHEQARGADFAWVFFARNAKNWPNAQIEMAAREMGVGIVAMDRPTVPSAWETILRARERPVTQLSRLGLLTRLEDAGR